MRRVGQRVIVITGASSGLGRAIARAAAERGEKIALLARGLDGLNAAAREVAAKGAQALVLPVDLADAKAVAEACDRIVATWGRIDAWINNAMVSVFAPISETTPAEYRRVMEVNYLGTVYGTLAALRQMNKQQNGIIVQIGSALAYRSIPLQSAYCASKAAIRGFTDSLRCELAHNGSKVKVTMLQLPALNTPQFEVVRNKLGQHPRPVPPTYQPEVIARAVLHAIDHPSRELWLGFPTLKAIIGQHLMPGILDRYLSKMAWNAQMTPLLPVVTGDNLNSPLPGDRGAHGSFDREARSFSLQIWLQIHAREIVTAIAVATLVAICLVW